MDGNEFLDKFKEKFISKKEQNEVINDEKKENDINKENPNNNNNSVNINNNDNNRNMEGGRVSKLFLRNMYKNQLSNIREEIEKENKIKKKQKKEKDKNDSLGDYSISSEEEEKKEEQNKNIQSQENDNLNSYFSSSNKKTNNITPPINNERTSMNKNIMLQYIKNLNKNEEINKNNSKKNKVSKNDIDISNNIKNESRKSIKEILQLNEERIKNLKDEKDKLNERNSIYAKNRANWNFKIKKLSDFIKSEKEDGQTNEEFYNENEDYIKKFGITNLKDFISIQEIIDKYDYNLDDTNLRRSCYLPSNPLRNQLKKIKEEFYKKINDNNNNKNNYNLVKTNENFSYSPNKALNMKKYNLTNKIVKVLKDNLEDKVSYIGKSKTENFETSHIENNIISKKIPKNRFTDLNTLMEVNSNNFKYEQLPKINRYNENILLKQEFTPVNFINKKNSKLLFRECDSNIEINYIVPKIINEIKNEISIDINKTYEKKNSNFTIDNNQNKKIEYIINPPLKKYKSENISIEKPFLVSFDKKLKYQITHQDNESMIRDKIIKYSNFDLTICHDVNNFYFYKKDKNKNLIIKKQVSQGSINPKPKTSYSITKEMINFSKTSEIKSNNNINVIQINKNKNDFNINNNLNELNTNNIKNYNNKNNNKNDYNINNNLNELNTNNIKNYHNKNNNKNEFENNNNKILNSNFNHFTSEEINISNKNEGIKLKTNIVPNKLTSQKYNNDNMNNNNNTIQKILEAKDIKNKYQKNIITSLDNITIMKYQINDSTIPLDPSFLDVLCINCYECIKFDEMDLHSVRCVIKLEDFKDNAYDEDYNTRIFKLHESLKNKKEEIENNKDKSLLNFYNHLIKIVYQILINNNSLEELDSSISEINKMIKNDIQKGNFTQNYKFYFLLFCQRLSQLVYMKLKDMEKLMLQVNQNSSKDSIDSLDEYNLNNNLDEDDEHIKYMKEQLTSIENETNKKKNELQQWKKEAKILENSLRKPQVQLNEQLSDIASDINSKNENYDMMTTFTGQMSDFGENDINEEDFDNFTEDDQKKYFLSIGLGIKFKYSEQIQENISISQLFDIAKSKGIKPQNYHDFLIKELNIKES